MHEIEELSLAISGVITVEEDVLLPGETLQLLATKIVAMTTFLDVVAALYLAALGVKLGDGGVREMPYAMLCGVITRLTIKTDRNRGHIKASMDLTVNNPESWVVLTSSKATDSAMKAISSIEAIDVSIGIAANRVTISIDDKC